MATSSGVIFSFSMKFEFKIKICYLKFPFFVSLTQEVARKGKYFSVLLVGSSDGANQPQFSSSEVPTKQTNSSSHRREFRRSKPTLVLLVGSSNEANQLQLSSSGVPTGQTNFSSPCREFLLCWVETCTFPITNCKRS